MKCTLFIFFLDLSLCAVAQKDTTRKMNTALGNNNQQIIGNHNKQVGRDLIEKKTIVTNNERHHFVDNSTYITNNYYQIQGGDSVDMATNFSYEFVDSLTLIVYPKTGRWEKPFVTVKYSEKDCLAGLSSGSKNVAEGLTNADRQTYSWAYDEPPATKFNPVIIELRCLPSQILFGDALDEKRVYMIYKKK